MIRNKVEALFGIPMATSTLVILLKERKKDMGCITLIIVIGMRGNGQKGSEKDVVCCILIIWTSMMVSGKAT